jgi:hypothetical protein
MPSEPAGSGAQPAVSRPRKASVLVSEHVFVVGHRVHVVARLVGVGARSAGGRRSGRRVVPGAEVTEDLFHHAGIVNDGDGAHGVLADRAAQRIDVPDPQDEVAPALGGEFGGGRRETPGRRTTSSGGKLRRMYWARSSRSALFSGGTGSPAWRLKPLCFQE